MKPYYQDNLITIYNNDCYELIPKLGSFDLVITDPPYEVAVQNGGGAFGDRNYLRKTHNFTDTGCDYKFLDTFPNWFCFCSKKQLIELLTIANTKPRWNLLTWCKTNPVPTCNNKYLPDLEFIIHGFNKNRLFGGYDIKSQFILCTGKKRASKHPNEKPVEIIEKLVKLGSKENESIIDPFAGSGTTGIVCKQLNRKCVLIERDEKWCEVSASRLINTSQLI